MKGEHILPQGFGLFAGNLVLHGKVCDDCNQILGDELDVRIARDTYQGLERFQTGIKDPSEYKHLGARSKISFKVREGLFEGSYAYIEYSQERESLVLKPIEQIGLLKRIDSKYDFFRLESFPPKEGLDLSRYDLKVAKGVMILSERLDEARRLLKSAGIHLKAAHPFESGKETYSNVLLEITTTVDDVIRRGIAKIAFDYLAYFNSADVLLSEAFDPVRFYIRNAETPDLPLVHFSNDPILHDEPKNGLQRVGHIVAVKWNAFHDAILSKVSLFNDLTCTVILAYGKRDIAIVVDKGSFWNIANMTVMEIESRRDA